MFENLAAIDIGTSSIKVITVKTGIKDFQIKSFAYEDVDHDIDHHEVAIKDTLTRILEGYSLKGYKILINLPMERTIIRNITFPFNDMEKIAKAIPFEAEEIIPFRLEDIIMDFYPLQSKGSEDGRILLAASHKDNIQDFLKPLEELDLRPTRLGIESMALYECYRYFNKIENETIVQLDIGHNKTIINIIKDNDLYYMRSISIGTSIIYKYISELNKTSHAEAAKLFEHLNLDLTSLENNIQKNYYKNYNINKDKLKKIYDKTLEFVYELIEQITLTIRAFNSDFGRTEFNRIMISGGGSNIIGIGSILSKDIELPVASLPFLDEHDEIRIQTQYPIALGIILSYLNKRHTAINLLKGEFVSEEAHSSRKVYYLAGAFVSLSIIILIVNILLTSFLKSDINKEYNHILNERLKRYFNTKQTTEDPIGEATKILKNEKKELGNLNIFLNSNEGMMDILNNLLSFFPKDESFELNNLVINERIIKINGLIESSRNIDEFKNKLIESKKYDSVTLNTNINRKNKVKFSMSIKLKLLNDFNNQTERTKKE
ncbi:MAG: pilus assembly protein PilM [Spirochaetota bacterium]|nr:pilus assembly protein PilM [Spirochaetota bacterium]